MKKLSLIFSTLLLAIILIACGTKDKLFAKVSIENIEREKTSITFDLDVEDPDEQLEAALNVIIKLDGKQINSSLIQLEDGDFTEIKFSNLVVNTNYEVVVNGTFLGKPVTLTSKMIKTQSEETKEISTIDEFLAIDNSYSTYKLVNDLDFSEHTGTKRITTLSAEFDGNGHTIKNYKFTNNTTNSGLFGTLSSTAKVHNLTIDSMVIEQTSDATTSRQTGLLAGRISSSNVEINNITIKNSKINYNINSSSNSTSVRVGLLVGTGRGTISNINIEDSNEINLNVNRYKNLFVGGLIGQVENVELTLSEINVAGNININVDQTSNDIKVDYDSKDKPLDNRYDLYVGGLIGIGISDKYIENIISSVNINYTEEQLKVNPEPKKTIYVIRLGGLFGETNTIFKNVLINGDIKVVTSDFIFDEKDDLDPTVERNYEIGGITGRYSGSYTNLEKIVRSDSEILVTFDETDTSIKTKVSTVTGSTYNALVESKFNYFGILTDLVNEAAIANSLVEIDNLKTFFDNEWFNEQLA